MKYLKTYEQINKGTPKIGDYVICEEIGNSDDAYNNFLKTTIGKIVSIGTSKYKYQVQYNNIPTKFLSYFGREKTYENCRAMLDDEIIYFSNNKEDLEPFIQSNKYNL